MKKKYIILIALIIIFLVVDIVFWFTYQGRLKQPQPNANIYLNDNSNAPIYINTNAPANINQPVNTNVNIPTDTNTNININTNGNINTNQPPANINAPRTDQQTQQLKQQIEDIVVINSGPLQRNLLDIRRQIIDLAPPEELEPALIYVAAGGDFKERFIALNTLFVLEYKKENKNIMVINALKNILGDTDFQIKLIAGEYLVMMGYKEGFPVIIQGLNRDDFAPYADPPTLIKAETYNLLKSMTRQNLDNDYQQWQTWWQTNKNSLIWDEQNQYFH